MLLRHSWTFNDKREQIYINVSGQFNKIQQGDSSREPKDGHGRERICHKNLNTKCRKKYSRIRAQILQARRSKIFTCKLLKIDKIQTSAYHPESNEALECSHRTLAEYFRDLYKQRHYINRLGWVASLCHVYLQYHPAHSYRIYTFWANVWPPFCRQL